MSILKLEFSQVAYQIDLAVFLIIPLMSLGVLWWACPAGEGWGVLAALILGFIGWTLLEYGLHRFVLHHVSPFKQWHSAHHEAPDLAVGTPTWVSLSLVALVIFLPTYWLMGLWLGAGFGVGLLIGYGIYTWLHHAEHHWRSNVPWFRRLKRMHAIHHHTFNESNYGVITLFWDRVFGTYRGK
ncbi:MAG: sterol desaturase family protein [Halothiobacillus sp.]